MCRRLKRRRIRCTPRRAPVLRTCAPIRDVFPAIVAVLQSVVPEVPKSNVRPLLDLADEGTKSWRLGAQLFGLFGITAAIMAGVGLYAALALMVRQRSAEIAVRMVLGATPGTVIAMVVRHVAGLLAVRLGVRHAADSAGGTIRRAAVVRGEADRATGHGAVTLLLCSSPPSARCSRLRAARLNPSTALRQ